VLVVAATMRGAAWCYKNTATPSHAVSKEAQAACAQQGCGRPPHVWCAWIRKDTATSTHTTQAKRCRPPLPSRAASGRTTSAKGGRARRRPSPEVRAAWACGRAAWAARHAAWATSYPVCAIAITSQGEGCSRGAGSQQRPRPILLALASIASSCTMLLACLWLHGS